MKIIFAALFKFSVKKAIALLFFALLYNYSIYAQQETDGEISYKNALLVEAKVNESIQLKDSLSIFITSFSFKRPYANGPTKITVHVALSKGNTCGEIEISLHSIHGKPEHTSTVSFWKEYKFQLHSYTYDPSFKIIVSKMERID